MIVENLRVGGKAAGRRGMFGVVEAKRDRVVGVAIVAPGVAAGRGVITDGGGSDNLPCAIGGDEVGGGRGVRIEGARRTRVTKWGEGAVGRAVHPQDVSAEGAGAGFVANGVTIRTACDIEEFDA